MNKSPILSLVVSGEAMLVILMLSYDDQVKETRGLF